MDKRNEPDRRLEERLRRGMRPGGLSPAQRRRHIDRINARGAWEMDFIRRRSFAELGVVVAVLLAVAAIGVWQVGLRDDDNSQSAGVDVTTPTVLPTAQEVPTTLPTPTAMPSSSCNVTPFDEIDRLDGFYPESFARWYEGDGIRLGLAELSAINPSLPASTDFWFTGTTPTVWHLDAVDVPVITARHLSEPAAQFDYVMQNPPYFPAMQSVLMFSEPGCWELSATTGEADLDIVIDVQPAHQRADHVIQYDMWQQTVPYAAPPRCDVTDWVLEDRNGSLGASFWFDDEGISMNNWSGIFLAGLNNQTFFLEEHGNTDIVITGWMQDDESVTLDIEMSSEHVTANLFNNRMLRAYLVFPEPGCWTIQAVAGDTAAQFNIFVYPSAEAQ